MNAMQDHCSYTGRKPSSPEDVSSIYTPNLRPLSTVSVISKVTCTPSTAKFTQHRSLEAFSGDTDRMIEVLPYEVICSLPCTTCGPPRMNIFNVMCCPRRKHS